MNDAVHKEVRLKDKVNAQQIFICNIVDILVGGFVGIWYFFWLSLFTSVRHRCMVIHLSGCLAAWY